MIRYGPTRCGTGPGCRQGTPGGPTPERGPAGQGRFEAGDPFDQGGDGGIELGPGESDQRDLQGNPGIGRLAHL